MICGALRFLKGLVRDWRDLAKLEREYRRRDGA